MPSHSSSYYTFMLLYRNKTSIMLSVNLKTAKSRTLPETHHFILFIIYLPCHLSALGVLNIFSQFFLFLYPEL